MENRTLISASGPYESFGRKIEDALCQMHPQLMENQNLHGIYIGSNRDGGVQGRGGHRVPLTNSTFASAIYFDRPEKLIPDNALPREDQAKRYNSVVTKAEDSILLAAAQARSELVAKGIAESDARKQVRDSFKQVMHFDVNEGKFVRTPVKSNASVQDSIISGLTTPFWDVAVIQKIFKQPFLRGYADGLVKAIGIPNMKADIVQLITESFEGYGRLAQVAKTTGALNTSIAGKNRTGTMFSELINIVIDFEDPNVPDQLYNSQPGNWISQTTIGDVAAYMDLMAEQMRNSLIYFGDAASGFEGCLQIANRDGTVEQYDGKPLNVLWDEEEQGVNQLVGAQLLVKFSHMLANRMEELNWLPTRCVVRMSPTAYKVMKFSMLSQQFNQNNPLSIINTVYESGNKLIGTMVNRSGDGVWSSFEILPDPMLAPNTPFNKSAHDLMFMVFPEIQSALEEGGVTNDLVMMPVPFERMLLPSAPGYRDGMVRQYVKRFGSILAPVEKMVHVIEGFGVNDWYVAP